MAGKIKTWVWVVVGVVVMGVLCLVGVAAAGLWYAKTHIDVRSVSPAAAVNDFEEVRRQFNNQKPLIELDERGHFLHANTDRPTSDRRPESLHVADELVDGSAVTENYFHHLREVFVQLPDDGLGFSLFGDVREPADVGEEHRHLAADAAELGPFGMREQFSVDVLRHVSAEQFPDFSFLAILDEILISGAGEERDRAGAERLD